MRAGEESYRLYSCGRCAQQVRICRGCDRGNQYCAGECARIRRRESLRRAGERYQQATTERFDTPRGSACGACATRRK